MNLLWAIVIGSIQGLTEFLPLSSSGHLVLIQSLVPNFSQPGVLFDVTVHLGTLFAIVFFFWKKIISLKQKDILLLIIGSIPVVFVGFFFADAIEALFNSVKLVGFALIITGIANYITDRMNKKKEEISLTNSLVIGAFQALAIIPGISRSGSTIFGGVTQGIERKKSAEFSFLLSIPAVFGANFYQIVKYGSSMEGDFLFYFLGFISAFIVGFLSIGWVLNFLVRRKFKYFAFYCFILGILILIF